VLKPLAGRPQDNWQVQWQSSPNSEGRCNVRPEVRKDRCVTTHCIDVSALTADGERGRLPKQGCGQAPSCIPDEYSQSHLSAMVSRSSLYALLYQTGLFMSRLRQ
jgi:hypothetical protein